MAGAISVDTSQLKKLAAELRANSPSMLKELQVGLRGAGTQVAVEARLISGFWSSRIPGSIRLISVGLNTVVRAGGASAPHAKYYEGPAPFRHPVFGHDVWVSQQARPFLMPAVTREGPTFERAALAAVDAVLLKAGFH